MFRATGPRRWRVLQILGVALYTAFVVMASFEHHDLLCELRTPQHCTSCTATQLGSDPHRPANPGGGSLVDAGQAVSLLVLMNGRLVAVRTTGRSPPSRS
jgi:hypothetical protein